MIEDDIISLKHEVEEGERESLVRLLMYKTKGSGPRIES